MNPQYRLLYFMTRPAIGSRIPIGAILQKAGGFELVRPRYLPDTSSLGSSALANAVRRALSADDRVTKFDELPPAVGPQVVMGPPEDAPQGISNPAEWLARYILPAAASSTALSGEFQDSLQ